MVVVGSFCRQIATMTVRRRAVIFGCMFAFFFVIFFRLALPSDETPEQKIASRQKRFPLVWQHIHQSSGHGGGELFPVRSEARRRSGQIGLAM
jgi:hypothetical protein